MGERRASRPFTWDDVDRLHALVARSRRVRDPASLTRIGDFWWTLRNTPAGEPLRHMQVWTHSDGSLIAVAFLDPPSSGDVIIAPDGDSAFDEALDWLEAEHRNAGSGELSIVVPASDQTCAEAMRRRGYAKSEGGNVRFWRSLDSALSEAPLPEGASVRGVATREDIGRRTFVEASSFGGSVTAEDWQSMTARLPNYRSELDLIAVAPDGAVASACTCFYDGATRCGEFEAVGTVKAYQRMGFGKAAITEGLQRLHRLGATQAIVETTIGNDAAIALYESCGFGVVAQEYRWTKRG